MRTCSIESCNLKHHAKGWCKKHYNSVKVYGDPLAQLRRNDLECRHILNNGYEILTNYRGHPLATVKGNVLTHRLVLWETLEEQAAPCHWCGVALHWFSDPRLIVDHLDHDRLNNELGNLVPSCVRCNSARLSKRPVFVSHGDLGMYTYHKCRCELCRSAMSAYQRSRRSKIQ